MEHATYRYGSKVFDTLPDLLDYVGLPLPREEIELPSWRVVHGVPLPAPAAIGFEPEFKRAWARALW